jgi:WhiB family redox-sensing transcriptional regulator
MADATDPWTTMAALLLQTASTGWASEALCAQTDPEVFFPEKGESSTPAKQICAGCPVRAECLQDALDRDERFGVWGAQTARERDRLRRGARQDAA